MTEIRSLCGTNDTKSIKNSKDLKDNQEQMKILQIFSQLSQELEQISKMMKKRNLKFKEMIQNMIQSYKINLDPIFDIQVNIINQLVENYRKLSKKNSRIIKELLKKESKEIFNISNNLDSRHNLTYDSNWRNENVKLDMSKVEASDDKFEEIYTPNFAYNCDCKSGIRFNNTLALGRKISNSISKKSQKSHDNQIKLSDSSYNNQLYEDELEKGENLSSSFSESNYDRINALENIYPSEEDISSTLKQKYKKNPKKENKAEVPRLNLDIKLSFESDDQYSFKNFNNSYYKIESKDKSGFDLHLNQTVVPNKKKRKKSKTKSEGHHQGYHRYHGYTSTKKKTKNRISNKKKDERTKSTFSDNKIAKIRKQLKKKKFKQILFKRKNTNEFEFDKFNKSSNLIDELNHLDWNKKRKSLNLSQMNDKKKFKKSGWKKMIKSIK